MSLRIPLTNDQTLQVEFHEIERRLRRLEKATGTGGENTRIVVSGGGGGVNLQPVYDRLTALEQAVAGISGISLEDIPDFGPVGSEAERGLVLDPGTAVPPDGVAQHVLTEDNGWGFPLRGLIGVSTSGEQTDPPYDVVNIHAGLQVGHVTAADLDCYNLYVHGDIEYTDTFWDDLRFPVQGINPAGTASPPSVDTTDPFAGTLLFSAASTNVIAGVAQMPHSWKIGTPVSPHIHWSPTSTDTGNVAWRFSYQIASINGTYPGTLTTAGIELDAGDGTTDKHQLHPFTDIDMSAYVGVSVIIIWKLERVGGDASDTYTDDARLLEVDFHYESDSPGSSGLYTK